MAKREGGFLEGAAPVIGAAAGTLASTIGAGMVGVPTHWAPWGTAAIGAFGAFTAIPSVAIAPTVASARLSLTDLGLPADARLVSTAVDGARIVLTYAYSGGNTLIFVDERRLTVLGRLDLPAAP